MDSQLKERLTARATWTRGLYMVLFAVLYSVAEAVLTAVVLFQFGSCLITGGTNRRLLDFSRRLSAYIYQIVQFLCFNIDDHPYPLGPWPQGIPTRSKSTRKSPPPAAGEQAEGSAGS